MLLFLSIYNNATHQTLVVLRRPGVLFLSPDIVLLPPDADQSLWCLAACRQTSDDIFCYPRLTLILLLINAKNVKTKNQRPNHHLYMQRKQKENDKSTKKWYSWFSIIWQSTMSKRLYTYTTLSLIQGTSSTTATVPRRSIPELRCNRRLHTYANRKLRSRKLFGRSRPTYTPYHMMAESRPLYLLFWRINTPLRLRRRYHADPLLTGACNRRLHMCANHNLHSSKLFRPSGHS